MCYGNYLKDPEFVARHRKIRYVRSKASYFLRGRYRKISGKHCVYCGFEAVTGDHVPSLFAGYTNGVINGVIVSACYDCNKHLGPFSSTCIRERAAYLVAVYKELLDGASRVAKPSSGTEEADPRVTLLELKLERCKERKDAENCNMLEGSAKLFKENGSVS